MASTSKTVNYELSQFEGTDKPSWEADYNADMLSIDTNLKAVSDVADGASGSISTLADRVTTAEGNITTNANDIDALEARADALESGETIADGRLDALEAEQLIQNTAIEGNTQLGYNLARPYDSASTYVVGAYVLFQNTLYKCTTAVTLGEAFDPNKWLAIKATDEISAGGYTLPTASASILGGVKVGDGLSIDGSGVLSSLISYYNGNNLGTVDEVRINNTVVSTITNITRTAYKIGNLCLVYCSITIPATNIATPITSCSITFTKNANVTFLPTTTAVRSCLPLQHAAQYEATHMLLNSGFDIAFTQNNFYITLHGRPVTTPSSSSLESGATLEGLAIIKL